MSQLPFIVCPDCDQKADEASDNKVEHTASICGHPTDHPEAKRCTACALRHGGTCRFCGRALDHLGQLKA